MAADTFVTALLLITAVISAGILINAVYPVVWNMAGTFSSASQETDTRMRTDFKVVATQGFSNYFGGNYGLVQIWMKNIGTKAIGRTEIQQSDIFSGPVSQFQRLQFDHVEFTSPPTTDPLNNKWTYYLAESNNDQWDVGETVEIDANVQFISTPNTPVYFQFVLSNGVWRSTEFTSI